MIELYLPEQVQQMDRRAFARGVSPDALMDRAALHLARGVIDAASGRRYGLRVLLVCGKGNNGADGIAAGRHLLGWGAAPTVVLVSGEESLGEEGVRELARYRRLGGRAADLDVAILSRQLPRTDVAVDCLLGTGATGAPRPPYDQAIAALNDFAGPVVACDLPSGVNASTGRIPDAAVKADLTVTLGAHKQGLWLHPAATNTGRLVLGELDVRDGEDPPAAHVLEPADLRELIPAPGARSHKRSRGVVVIYAGSKGMSGAAVLAARGALGGGAGLVTVMTPPESAHYVAPAVPEALTVRLPDDADGIVEAITEQVDKADTLIIGPGLGLAEHTQRAVRRLVAEVTDAAVLLDADGLNAFRDVPGQLAEHACETLALTPHSQELGRLIDSSGHGVHARRTEIAREQAAAWSATLLAKGPRTVIAAPDGRTWVTPTGGPALATGGTGDVLSGLTGALLAQHPRPESVACAAYLHGLAGDLAGAARSDRATTAGDVADALGAAALSVGV